MLVSRNRLGLSFHVFWHRSPKIDHRDPPPDDLEALKPGFDGCLNVLERMVASTTGGCHKVGTPAGGLN